MALFARCLAPHGVAFVSYNALPGARLRTMLREMALLHAGAEAGLAERVDSGRELYEFLAPWAENRPDAYGAVLARELARLRRLPKPVLAHDDLGERYDPVWLRDVALHAERHGLRYLADAEPRELRADRQPPGVDEQLDALAGGDRVVWEQYADLLAGRAFRQTLLCRADAPLDDAIDPARLARLWFRATESAGIGAPARRGAPATTPPATARAGRRGGAAGARAAALAARSASCASCSAARTRARSPTSCGARSGPARSSSRPPRTATSTVAGERPEASPVARWQAARGPELTSLATSRCGWTTRSAACWSACATARATAARSSRRSSAAVGGELRLTMEGEPVTDGELVRGQIAGGLERNLRSSPGSRC